MSHKSTFRYETTNFFLGKFDFQWFPRFHNCSFREFCIFFSVGQGETLTTKWCSVLSESKGKSHVTWTSRSTTKMTFWVSFWIGPLTSIQFQGLGPWGPSTSLTPAFQEKERTVMFCGKLTDRNEGGGDIQRKTRMKQPWHSPNKLLLCMKQKLLLCGCLVPLTSLI